jgi:hypothetical protein
MLNQDALRNLGVLAPEIGLYIVIYSKTNCYLTAPLFSNKKLTVMPRG